MATECHAKMALPAQDIVLLVEKSFTSIFGRTRSGLKDLVLGPIVLPNNKSITFLQVNRRNLASTFDSEFAQLKVLRCHPKLKAKHGLSQVSLVDGRNLLHLLY